MSWWNRTRPKKRITLRSLPEGYEPPSGALVPAKLMGDQMLDSGTARIVSEPLKDAEVALAARTEFQQQARARLAAAHDRAVELAAADKWDGTAAWAEHTAPAPEPVYVDPEPATCGAVGMVEGKETVCYLTPGHRYLNGKLSPHKGVVPTVRTWTNTG